MDQATLRLFNALQIDTPPTPHDPLITKRGLRHGYILDPAIQPTSARLNLIEDLVSISGPKANAAFHKSWRTIEESSLETLVIQQILHYISTYGFEKLGIYNQDTVYIPNEQLDLPDIGDDIPLTVIKGMTADQLLQEILKLAAGIALGPDTLADIMTIITTNQYPPDFLPQIQNRELLSKLRQHYQIVPTDPTEYLRFLINALTGSSLIIKNKQTIDAIKQADKTVLDPLLDKAPADLASIFFRFKPLFLAMKSISANKTFFNRLRKQADKLHRPLPPDYLNNITTQIQHGQLDLNKLQTKLEKAPIFRQIRLAYALNFRLHAQESITYRIRNGRAWATQFDWPTDLNTLTQQALGLVTDQIITTIRPHVTDKTIYIPTYAHYTLPATEKQFTGHFPTGSYFTLPQDLIIGIHWTNTDKRVDLDLSVIDDVGKIGWDADYRADDNTLLFSGDITDAPPPLGAAELFYLKDAGRPKILMLNYFNYDPRNTVPTKILVAHEEPETFGNNYMVDPNKIIASALVNVRQKQTILGLIATIDGQNRFYFSHMSLGRAITAAQDNANIHARQYLINALTNPLDFRHILHTAGATIVDQQPKTDNYINLAPHALTKTSFLDLLQPPTP
ncbi:MAG TPA: hypothetical protein VLL52_21795 [Anaerolineae bacterium]|nr:hypothetical protein [Anaerolineae bacterium]